MILTSSAVNGSLSTITPSKIVTVNGLRRVVLANRRGARGDHSDHRGDHYDQLGVQPYELWPFQCRLGRSAIQQLFWCPPLRLRVPEGQSVDVKFACPAWQALRVAMLGKLGTSTTFGPRAVHVVWEEIQRRGPRMRAKLRPPIQRCSLTSRERRGPS